MPTRPADHVPLVVRVAAAWAWRLLLIAALVALVGYVAATLRLVVLPVIVALFLTVLLQPVKRRIEHLGAPPALAAAAAVGALVAATGGVIALIVPRVVDELGTLGRDVESGARQVIDWLSEGPLNASDTQIQNALDSAVDQVQDNLGTVGSGVVSGASLLLELTVGVLLALVLTFFLLKDGHRLWAWTLERVAPDRRPRVEDAGERVWATLGAYLRGVTIVALFDAAFIGLALVLIGVPLALPLTVLTFIGAYIPIAGATVAGAAAVLVALVAGGVDQALLVLAAVVFVQQVESQLLQPVVVGRAVELHPAVVLVAVTAGAIVYGVVGAALAAPLVAVVKVAAGSTSSEPAEAEPAEAEPAGHRLERPGAPVERG